MTENAWAQLKIKLNLKLSKVTADKKHVQDVIFRHYEALRKMEFAVKPARCPAIRGSIQPFLPLFRDRQTAGMFDPKTARCRKRFVRLVRSIQELKLLRRQSKR